LPFVVQLVAVAQVERLGGEGVVLHIHVGARDCVHERRLAHVGVAHDE